MIHSVFLVWIVAMFYSEKIWCYKHCLKKSYLFVSSNQTQNIITLIHRYYDKNNVLLIWYQSERFFWQKGNNNVFLIIVRKLFLLLPRVTDKFSHTWKKEGERKYCEKLRALSYLSDPWENILKLWQNLRILLLQIANKTSLI